MNPKIQAKLSDMARSSKLSCMLALIFLFILYVAISYILNVAPTSLQGNGWVIWPLFGIQVLVALWTAGTFAGSLSKDRNFYSASALAQSHTRLSSRSNVVAADVIQWVGEVAEKAGFGEKDYTLLIAADNTPNAFTAGSGSGRVVVLHAGLFGAFTNDAEAKTKGVVAHEFGHQKANDIYFLVFTQALLLSFVIIGQLLFRFGAYLGGSSKDDKKEDKKGNSCWLPLIPFAIGALCLSIGYLVAPIAVAFFNRRREEMADGFAAALGYGEGLAAALADLGNSPKTKPINAAAAALYINEAHSDNPLARLFGTHPPISERVTRLKKLLAKDEGLVPDAIEYPVRFILTWIVLPLIGAGILLGREDLALPNFFGVPLAFIATVVWLWAVMLLLSQGATTSAKLDYKKKTTWLVLLPISFIFLGGVWYAGYTAIDQSYRLASLAAFAPIMMVVWIGKPIMAFLGGMGSGFFGMLSDLASYASICYGAAILAVLFISGWM